MIITYFGHSCFRIQDKVGSDGVSLATDPFDKTLGLKVPNFEADIVTVSHDRYDHNNVSALRGTPFVIDCPGEYDSKGILVQGIASYYGHKEGEEKGDNTICRIEVDGITVVHLGDLGHKLTDKELEDLDGVDVLLIPVGGTFTVDAKEAASIVSQIEPRIVIPMHYKMKGANIDVDEVDKFIKEIGISPTQEEKLKINKKDLPQEGMELVILTPFNN